MQKTESKDNTVSTLDESSKEFTKNYGIGKHFKIIIAAVVIIAIIGVAAFFMSTQTVNVEEEFAIPEGFKLNPEESGT